MSMPFSDKNINSLFDNPLTVPDYQRPYAWENKQVEEFFDDLCSFIDNGDEDYLFGQIIIHNLNFRIVVLQGISEF